MRRATVFIAAGAAALVAASFWLGVREGTELAARLEKIPGGAVSLALLEVANERTCQRPLRALCAAAHVERKASHR